ncbi:YhcH/YjgK/YiaL family protein [Natranaerovirga pectinivora]|uniref:YhcH/YjgK/YiaL family protein n=1 Tax=Natranaerovirga pectinivora TaxID=682400 RepID=A0A4R3MHD2_9FIRM|nr:YhcH/YjgK/YiaL family protein [Natranaerovirga pectinivora]TCT12994.1 YhcH/YjgK/YiaL family protein [Natranaerovirga pectinivora]
MIFSNLKTWDNEKSAYSETIRKAVAFLQEKDCSKLEEGKHVIDGDKIFANVMDKVTESKEKRAPEAHIKYIDIQYVESGIEVIGFAKMSDELVVAEDSLEAKDLIKYTNEVPNEVDLKLLPGDFGIFFPDDVHRPLCAFDGPANVRKVVIKVAVDAL